MFVSGLAQAKSQLAHDAKVWLTSMLPAGAELRLNRAKIKFDGCKHKDYELILLQPVTKKLSFEGSYSYSKTRIRLGSHNQQIKYSQLSLTPRWQASEKVSWGAGVSYQSAPAIDNGDLQFDLPASRTFSVSGRLQLPEAGHQLELEVAQQRWQATHLAGSFFAQSQAQHQITLNYQGQF